MPLLTMSMTQDNPEFYHADDSQEGKILDYLKQGYPLSPMGALRLFGCFRLASRVCQLRKEGWDIRCEIVKGAEGKRWAKYHLAEK